MALYSEYLNGDSLDRGWNGAISYQNDERNIKIAATYRSKINLTLNGTSNGFYNKYLTTHNIKNAAYVIPFNTKGKVKVPLPAVLNIAISKKINKTTIEFVYDKTYWSSYKKLDIDFKDPAVDALFGTAIPKKWKNSNTYRIGLTHKCNKKTTAMIGYAYDETPVPDSTVDFSLPDNDKHIFSAGLKYKLNKNFTIGFSALITKAKSRKAKIYDRISNSYTTGEFKKGGAYLVAFGFSYGY